MKNKEAFEVSVILPVMQEDLYRHWISSTEHTNFTGSPAKIDPEINGSFSAWDGYITGKNISMEPFRRIVQSWRTTEFSDEDEDSKLEVLFEAKADQTKLTLRHANIPDGQGNNYKDGWREYYFEPMLEYYSSKGNKKQRTDR